MISKIIDEILRERSIADELLSMISENLLICRVDRMLLSSYAILLAALMRFEYCYVSFRYSSNTWYIIQIQIFQHEQI